MDMGHMHGGDSSSSSGGGGMMMMGSGFVSGPGTPLYGTAWTPTNAGQYAGTCFFLIFLGAALRVLLAVKATFEHKWARAEQERRIVVVRGKNDEGLQEATRGQLVEGSKKTDSKMTDVRILKPVTGTPPWRLTTDGVRAIIVVITAGVSYLLMLAVMTYDVGYFLSVLGGIFAGELAAGRHSRGA